MLLPIIRLSLTAHLSSHLSLPFQTSIRSRRPRWSLSVPLLRYICIYIYIYVCVCVCVCMDVCMDGWMDGWISFCVLMFTLIFITQLPTSTPPNSFALSAALLCAYTQHPHVYSNGHICLSILFNEWYIPANSLLLSVILSFQRLCSSAWFRGTSLSFYEILILLSLHLF